MRSLMIGCLSIVVSCISFSVGWILKDWRTGLVAALVTMGIGVMGLVVSLLFIRRLTWPDVFAPLLFSVIWSILLAPIKLITDDFLPVFFVGAGIMLFACLWLYKSQRIGKAYLVLPMIVYLYEMLPITIPGPFDDVFAMAGDAGATIIAVIRASVSNNVSQIQGPDDHQAIEVAHKAEEESQESA